MKYSSTATKNIAGATGSRLVSMAIAAVSVPLLLQLIGREQYGTWVTLASLVSLVSTLDLGVGNSLRNSVSLMIGSGSASAAAVRQEFVSFFHLLCGIGLAAASIFLLVTPVFPLLADNRSSAFLLYLPVLLLIPFLLGANVLQGARKIGLQAFLQAAGQWLFFLFVVCCRLMSYRPTLNSLAAAWASSYALPLLIGFALALRIVGLPRKHLLHLSQGSFPTERLKVGVSFLVLQLSSLVLYGMGNAIVFHTLGPDEVARYDVLNRIFQIGLGFYTIVIGVMWSEIARLRALRDFVTLRSLYRKTLLVALVFSLGAAIVACCSPLIVTRWTGHKLGVGLSEALSIAFLVSVQAFAYVGAVFMNAFEKVGAQVALGLVSIVLMVPISLFMIGHGAGIAAVPLSAALLTLLPLIVCNVKAVGLIRGPERADAV